MEHDSDQGHSHVSTGWFLFPFILLCLSKSQKHHIGISMETSLLEPFPHNGARWSGSHPCEYWMILSRLYALSNDCKNNYTGVSPQTSWPELSPHNGAWWPRSGGCEYWMMLFRFSYAWSNNCRIMTQVSRFKSADWNSPPKMERHETS